MKTPIQILRAEIKVMESFKQRVISDQNTRKMRNLKTSDQVEEIVKECDKNIQEFKDAITKLTIFKDADTHTHRLS